MFVFVLNISTYKVYFLTILNFCSGYHLATLTQVWVCFWHTHIYIYIHSGISTHQPQIVSRFLDLIPFFLPFVCL